MLAENPDYEEDPEAAKPPMPQHRESISLVKMAPPKYTQEMIRASMELRRAHRERIEMDHQMEWVDPALREIRESVTALSKEVSKLQAKVAEAPAGKGAALSADEVRDAVREVLPELAATLRTQATAPRTHHSPRTARTAASAPVAGSTTPSAPPLPAQLGARMARSPARSPDKDKYRSKTQQERRTVCMLRHSAQH